MLHTLAQLVRSQFLGLIALLLVLTGGAAYAATAAKDSVVSRSIKNGQVKTVDLKDGAVSGAKLTADSVTGDHVMDGSLTGGDVAANTLTGADVADSSLVGNDIQDNTITGADVNESTLGTVNNAAALGGVDAALYLKGAIYKRVGTIGDGQLLGDGTYTQAVSCDAGDLLLNGGPGDIAKTTVVLESLPSGGDLTVTNSWTVRVNKFGNVDPYNVIVVCVDRS